MNKRQVIRNEFTTGSGAWHSYDYRASDKARRNIFILATWEQRSGVNDSGYICCDESHWRIDTPEQPHSILPLLKYPSWVGEASSDLRGAEVSVRLRRDGARLYGAKCFFWILAAKPQTRWHYTKYLLAATDDVWADQPLKFVLEDIPSRLHRSWSANSTHPTPLENTPINCISTGLSFMGFSREVTDTLSMDDFEIKFTRSDR